jgi:2-acylglycerol O-acyltransferase 2
MVCGIGADAVFHVPFMRQMMAWIGTVPASRQNISRLFAQGKHVGVCPGGIAEMFLVSETEETIFLRKRQGTVRAAIQEGAHIVPVFFFGNSRLFKVAGQSGSDSWLSRLSRRLRTSVVLFYGRHGLPVPLRRPLHIATGAVVAVQQCDAPSEEAVAEVQARLIASIEQLYRDKRPAWETRPLVIA